jgi:hypothetical protein
LLDRFAKPLQDALATAKAVGEMKRSESANRLWEAHYECLLEAGDQVTACERARPQVLRLSMLYALLGGSAIIQIEHLRAALAVWDYCEASARLIFGGGLATPTQEPLAVRMLNAITASPGINRTGLREVAGHKVPAEDIEKALAWLEAQGLAHRGECGEGPGRKPECWWPGPKPGPEPGANAESVQHDGACIASGEGRAPASHADADAGSEGREGGNSSPGQTLDTEPISSLHPPETVAEQGQGEGPEPIAPSLPRSPEADTQPPAGSDLLPPSQSPLLELFANVRAVGGRFVRCGGVVSVEATSVTPEIEASVQAHQSDLLLLVPEPDEGITDKDWEDFVSGVHMPKQKLNAIHEILMEKYK